MEFALSPSDPPNDSSVAPDVTDDPTFQVSAEPVIEQGSAARAENALSELPRTYGTQTLCLMARDPHTLFAYWDIDWEKAFRDQAPRDRQVHLLLLSDDGFEESRVEIEPMAGSCYINVRNADAAYSGELGYFGPEQEWTSLAHAQSITTPPDALSDSGDADFATVPFHLAFQHMIDLLRISKQENESLTAMLSDLRQRSAEPSQASPSLTPDQRELAQVVETVAAANPPDSADAQPNFWTRPQLERILGFGSSSPTSGFGGGS